MAQIKRRKLSKYVTGKEEATALFRLESREKYKASCFLDDEKELGSTTSDDELAETWT